MGIQSAGQSKRNQRHAVRERAAERRQAVLRRQRRKRMIARASGTAAVIVTLGIVAVLASALGGNARSPSPAVTSALAAAAGPEGIAIESGSVLASDTTGSSGATKDGIACNSGEGSAEHIHTHLAVYVKGSLRPIPAGIGVVAPAIQDPGTADAFAQATKCYYWLHVHARDGVVHIEAPTKARYTLGQFFAVWGQPLTSSSVAGATGAQRIYVNGRIVTGNPAKIALGLREDIQIDVGKAEPFHPVDWSKSQL